ncbi:hypothetical protein D3C85_1204620 [compost metagenome]
MKANTNGVIVPRKSSRHHMIRRSNRSQLILYTLYFNPVMVILFFEIPQCRMTPNAGEIRINCSRDQVTQVLRQMKHVLYLFKKFRFLLFNPVQLQTRIKASQDRGGRDVRERFFSSIPGIKLMFQVFRIGL